MDQQQQQQQQPLLSCASCRARLLLVRGDGGGASSGGGGGAANEAAARRFGGAGGRGSDGGGGGNAAAAGSGFALGGAAGRGLEESFVVLPGGRGVGGGGGGGPGSSGGGGGGGVAGASGASAAPSAGPNTSGGGGIGVGGSGAGAGAGAGAAAAGSSSSSTGAGLDAKLSHLAALCELAGAATGVDHPLCLDCAAQLRDEVAAQAAEAEAEARAYERALQRLQREAAAATTAAAPLPAAAFEAELAALEAAARAARGEARAAEAEERAAAGELRAQAAVAADVAALEASYWHDLNAAALALSQHARERDALLARIDAAGQQLLLLRGSSALNDAFRIWHDGPFGTISGLRLGRTPQQPVPWDEINAAWGQAVLLLHTMAQQCRLTFSAYRLLPMGSHPRVADKRGATHDLFGPVSRLWGGGYDAAMLGFLACLQEFGEHAAARDAAEGRAPAFEFPFAIDGDRVGGAPLRLSPLGKDLRWTKALKLLLANLKVALQWVVSRELAAASAPPALPSLGQEGAVGASG